MLCYLWFKFILALNFRKTMLRGLKSSILGFLAYMQFSSFSTDWIVLNMQDLNTMQLLLRHTIYNPN